MRRAKRQFDEAEAGVLIVGMGTGAETKQFKQKFKIPYPMVCDPEKRLYKAFDLGRISLAGVLKPGIAIKGMAAMAKGHGIGLPKGDVRQLPGVFIIDTDGAVLYSHYAKDPADHPNAIDILSLL